MTERKAPREFWIDPKDMNQVYMRRQPNKIILDQFILVREVLPDEPDWKAIAQELAEALESARDWAITYVMQTLSKAADKDVTQYNKALAKFEEMKK